MSQENTGTHFSSLKRSKRVLYDGLDTLPSNPENGEYYYDNNHNRMAVYNGSQWYYANFTTTTSSSTSTTTTSTSTSSTSSSTSTSTSTSTSSSTSTTTTL